ncbi:precorrin-2 dehydrogenase/sirohydrochlorin ferrochelatase family protein [Robertmurraya korlensis]|uniref:precorrin-2 dehydrogenase/sirohydrochlorin ferrochelatase family protein n=1 Tax=Robertmurraya korlensis TaxID=519977 RepID=UPI000825E700|nr:NAD(P)-dependent oxidoreductase [Robertmurraya korlensis]
MDNLYPVFLNLTNKKVYVIGGGQIAARKIEGLLQSGATITIISPTVIDSIGCYVNKGLVHWIQKTFELGDIEDAFYIISATNDPHVSSDLKKGVNPNQLVNFADDHSSSNTIVPSVVRRGRLAIAVSTSGASPSLTKKIKHELEENYGQEYEDYVEFLMQKRIYIQEHIDDLHKRRKLLSLLVEDPIYRTDEREKRFQKIYKKINGEM